MDRYLSIIIHVQEGDQKDTLIATIAQLPFCGFEENENELIAWFEASHFEEEKLKEILEKNHVSYQKKFTEDKNWNEEWETQFSPIIIGGKIAIRAKFHTPIDGMEHEIIITPKMSFGTGHHATTALMIEEMYAMDFEEKKVFDFGAGTGILSIFAEKRGASAIFSIDNDPVCSENFKENVEDNFCEKIFYKQTDTPPVNEKFDIILANINRHILIEFLPLLSNMLKPKGKLLMSGILQSDEEKILHAASNTSLKHFLTNVKDSWLLMLFTVD
ncbi:MAG: 50S ribosomal protein L11 methyltransferase [Bacteroidetes bacterium]|nr:50S ribosomal protein L11 methyltransferase [Bacteroidota bacterium]